MMGNKQYNWENIEVRKVQIADLYSVFIDLSFITIGDPINWKYTQIQLKSQFHDFQNNFFMNLNKEILTWVFNFGIFLKDSAQNSWTIIRDR